MAQLIQSHFLSTPPGRDWTGRPPPRGHAADTYTLCDAFQDTGICHYGLQCVEAHGADELAEWRERFEYRRMRLQRASETELYGKSYTEQLLERWVSAASPERVMRERLDGCTEVSGFDGLVATVASKSSQRDWTFELRTRRPLRAVALLQDAHRSHFALKRITAGATVAVSDAGVEDATPTTTPPDAVLTSDQEWVLNAATAAPADEPAGPLLQHSVRVAFSTDIYGTFRQTIVFDLGGEPVLFKNICVDVCPVTDADKLQELRNDLIVSAGQRWNAETAIIHPYEPPVVAAKAPLRASSAAAEATVAVLTAEAEAAAAVAAVDERYERDMMDRYPCPRASTFTLTQSTITEKRLTKNNYRSRQHELLYVEEIARYDQVARYNLSTRLAVCNHYLLTPSGMATSTAKYAHSGELFAQLTLGRDVSEDTSAGRLILNNCATVYVAAKVPAGTAVAAAGGEKRAVYVAQIEDKSKAVIYLRMSAQAVAELGMENKTEFEADVQFQLNRLAYCEWHHALDNIADFGIIFPEVYAEPSIPWTPQRQWAADGAQELALNSKQREAVTAITTPAGVPLPPILLIGPFGTGKTFTLASSMRQVLLQADTKILICTHSNSAADLYIKDYLHPWVEEGMVEATPLRVYYHKRWVTTVPQAVQKVSGGASPQHRYQINRLLSPLLLQTHSTA